MFVSVLVVCMSSLCGIEFSGGVLEPTAAAPCCAEFWRCYARSPWIDTIFSIVTLDIVLLYFPLACFTVS